ncbi:MAG: tetratricopeptide repeat protein [Chlamydiia bacterium]
MRSIVVFLLFIFATCGTLLGANSSHQAPLTYDNIANMIEQIESGELEKHASLEDLERINEFLIFLTRQGVLPGTEMALEESIERLLYGQEHPFELADPFAFTNDYFVSPTVYQDRGEIVLCGFLKKFWKKTKAFIKENKTLVWVGAGVTAAGIAIYAFSSDDPGAMAAAPLIMGPVIASSNTTESTTTQAEEPTSITPPQQTFQEVKATFEKQTTQLKDLVVNGDFFPNPQSAFAPTSSLIDQGRTLGALIAHETAKSLENNLPLLPAPELQNSPSNYVYPSFELPLQHPYAYSHTQIDQTFGTNFSPFYLFNSPTPLIAAMYQQKGENAYNQGQYTVAVYNLGKTIECNPNYPNAYLNRSMAFYQLGQFQQSQEDFSTFKTLTTPEMENPSATSLSLAFARGVTRGVASSGKGLLYATGELALFGLKFHYFPGQTILEIANTITELTEIIKEQGGHAIGEALVPEVYDLINQWTNLSDEARAEQLGLVFGKIGSDIFLPGTACKIARKGTKATQALMTMQKGLQRTEKIAILEAASTLERGAVRAAATEGGTNLLTYGPKEPSVLTAVEQQWCQKYKSVEKYLKTKDYLRDFPNANPERLTPQICNEILVSKGIQTFPKPEWIPNEWRVKFSKNGAGLIYQHPLNENTSLRIMPGKLNSPNPAQQKPYFVCQKDGKFYDALGHTQNEINISYTSKSPETHIPMEEIDKLDWIKNVF